MILEKENSQTLLPQDTVVQEWHVASLEELKCTKYKVLYTVHLFIMSLKDQDIHIPVCSLVYIPLLGVNPDGVSAYYNVPWLQQYNNHSFSNTTSKEQCPTRDW